MGFGGNEKRSFEKRLREAAGERKASVERETVGSMDLARKMDRTFNRLLGWFLIRIMFVEVERAVESMRSSSRAKRTLY